MSTPEGRFKSDLKHLLEKRGAFWSMIKGGANSKNGDPDMIVCYKGRYIGIEAKDIYGSQSEWQKLRQKQIEDAGGIYILAKADIKTVEDVLDRIDEESQ